MKTTLAVSAAALCAPVAFLLFSGPACIPETCGPAVGSELRNLQAEQEIRFAERGRYETSLEALGVARSPGITVELRHAAPDGWSARAHHEELPGLSCVIWEGAVPTIPQTELGTLAEEPSRLYCDFPT